MNSLPAAGEVCKLSVDDTNDRNATLTIKQQRLDSVLEARHNW